MKLKPFSKEKAVRFDAHFIHGSVLRVIIGVTYPFLVEVIQPEFITFLIITKSAQEPNSVCHSSGKDDRFTKDLQKLKAEISNRYIQVE